MGKKGCTWIMADRNHRSAADLKPHLLVFRSSGIWNTYIRISPFPMDVLPKLCTLVVLRSISNMLPHLLVFRSVSSSNTDITSCSSDLPVALYSPRLELIPIRKYGEKAITPATLQAEAIEKVTNANSSCSRSVTPLENVESLLGIKGVHFLWLAVIEGYEMVSTDEKDEPFVLEKDQCWVVADNENIKPKLLYMSRVSEVQIEATRTLMGFKIAIDWHWIRTAFGK